MCAHGGLFQKFADGLLAGGFDGTDQQAILAQVKHIQRPAAFQAFPAAPLQRENRLAFLVKVMVIVFFM